jgi:hypothetical protein
MRVGSTLIFAAAALAAERAAAANCPPGQLYRVKLDECVNLTSALARPYLGEATRKTTRHAQPVRMAKRIDPGFVDPPPEASDPEAPKADPSDDPPDETDNWVWSSMPPVSVALWGHPDDPLDLLRQPQGPDPGFWPSLPSHWSPE